MARWFRSEPMEYISLIVNEDAAHDCLADLGRLGVIQFTDVSVNRRLKISSLLLYGTVILWNESALSIMQWINR